MVNISVNNLETRVIINQWFWILYESAFNPFRSDPGQREKLTESFIFTLLFGASKGFMKALKAFARPFKAPERSVKVKI